MLSPDLKNSASRISIAAALAFLISACGGDGGSDISGAAGVVGAGGTGGGPGGSSIGPSTPTGIITHRDFIILYDDADPQIFDNLGAYTQKPIVVSIHADDIFDLPVSNAVVNFATEWGTFTTSDSCVLSNGTCSVTWIPGNPAVTNAPGDCLVGFTAWAVGEEQFADVNANNLFDLGEPFIDLEEPYLDLAGNGVFDLVCNPDFVCETIDIVNFDGTTPGTGNGVHDIADGFYNGSLCASVATNPFCSATATSTVIHTRSELRIKSLPAVTCP